MRIFANICKQVMFMTNINNLSTTDKLNGNFCNLSIQA